MNKLNFLVLAGLVFTGVASAAQTYPLRCRGGAGTFGLSNNGSNVPVGVFYFTKSNYPAGASGQNLSRGQCSWLDRKIGPNEPTCLQQLNVKGAAWIFPDQIQNSYFGTQNAEWMRNMKGDVVYTFQAYNPGNGCFIITSFGQ